MSYFLELEMDHHSDGSITISQKVYFWKVLQRFGFGEFKAFGTLMFKEPST